jgi:hypothetical protein
MLNYSLRGPREAAQWSSLYLGPYMVGTCEAFWWCRRLDLASLVATLALVGGDVEGLHCPLHRPITVADREGYMTF